MNENRNPVIAGVSHAVTITLAVYGVYAIAKIGYEWAKIGVDAIKNRKEINI